MADERLYCFDEIRMNINDTYSEALPQKPLPEGLFIPIVQLTLKIFACQVVQQFE